MVGHGRGVLQRTSSMSQRNFAAKSYFSVQNLFSGLGLGQGLGLELGLGLGLGLGLLALYVTEQAY